MSNVPGGAAAPLVKGCPSLPPQLWVACPVVLSLVLLPAEARLLRRLLSPTEVQYRQAVLVDWMLSWQACLAVAEVQAGVED